MSVCTQSAWIRPSRSQKWDGPDLTPASNSAAVLPQWRKAPHTADDVKDRTARMRDTLFGHLGCDPRDEGPRDVVGAYGPFHAPPRPAAHRMSPEEACRRYLREWRAILRRNRWGD